MTTTTTTTQSGRSFGYGAIAAVVVGALVFGYGLLLASVSPLGGLHVAAIGLSLVLAGTFSTPWAGRRLGVGDADRRTLTLAFTGLAAVLLVAFVVLNGFGGVEAGEESSAALTAATVAR